MEAEGNHVSDPGSRLQASKRRRRMALVVDDAIAEGALVANLARQTGLTVLQATDADSALAAVEGQVPDLILLDVHLPGREGRNVLAEIRHELPFVPVVVLSSTDECLHAEDSKSLGAVEVVRRPIRLEEFHAALSRVSDALDAEDAARDALLAGIDHRTTLELSGSPEVLSHAVAWLGRELRGFFPGHDLPFSDIKLALYEALANAVEHGNLEIDYDDKGEALDRHQGLRRLVAERLKSPPYANRKVHIRAAYQADRVTYAVRDEGRGFDPRLFDTADALADPQRLHGRGLALIRGAMDEVTWNEDGTEIRMTLRIAKRTRAVDPDSMAPNRGAPNRGVSDTGGVTPE